MRTEQEEQELREAAEKGRRYKIAGEVFGEFLDNRREEIVRGLESGAYKKAGDLVHTLSELEVIHKFRSVCKAQIDLGEIAEKELSENASE